MSAKLPKRIHIGPRRLYVNRGPLESEDGTYNPNDGTITICEDIEDPRLEVTTLLHECLHAIFDNNGDSELYSDEPLINRTSAALAQIVIDSPSLLEYFQQIKSGE